MLSLYPPSQAGQIGEKYQLFYFAQFDSPLSAPAPVSSAAAFAELKRSSVPGDSDHLLITGPDRNISY